jgi:NADH dehydrogenase
MLHVVTGAFGYTGRAITTRLLNDGHRVRTLTNSPDRRHGFGSAVEVHPLAFDDPASLIRSLTGVDVLYNTYWVRYNHRLFTQADAVEHTKTLFQAAREADVRRIVHVSITNPSLDSPLEYFRSKAVLEQALIDNGSSHAIVRPAVLFGRRDILINNIAWVLRHLPIFGVFGDGSYKLQPMHVDDMAALMVGLASAEDNAVVDAIGPETFTYRELVETVGGIIEVRRRIVSVPPGVGHAVGWVVGRLVGDVTITRAEIKGLMDGLLCTDSMPTGSTKLTEWATEQADTLGKRYASELKRRTDRKKAYTEM